MRRSIWAIPVACCCSCNQTDDIEFQRARAIDVGAGGLSGTGGANAAGGAQSGGTTAAGAPPLAWSSVPSPGGAIHGLWGSAANDVWAVGSSPSGSAVGILHWDGKTWSSLASDQAGVLYSVWGSARDDVWAVGESSVQSRALLLHWNGSSWTDAPPPPTDTQIWWAVSGSSKSDVWVVGDTAWRWDGNAWASTQGPGFPQEALWISSSRDVWTGGGYENNDKVFHWDGQSWSEKLASATFWPGGIWGATPTDVWLVGTGIMHWDGARLEPLESSSSSFLAGIWGSSANDIWCAGYSVSGPASNQTTSSLLRHWDGDAWSNSSLPSTALLRAVWGTSSTDVWAAGDGVILHGQPK